MQYKTTAPEGALPDDPPGFPPPPRWIGIIVTIGLIGVTALLLRILSDGADSTPSLFLLVAVLVSAGAFGFWTGLLAAVLAFGALNYLFTEPLYTFHIARPQDLFALVVFLILAALVGLLAGRLHDRAEAAQARAEALAILGALSSDLGNAGTRDAAIAAALGHLAVLGGRAVVVVLQDGRPKLTQYKGMAEEELTPSDFAAMERCLTTGRIQPAAAAGWPGANLTFLPVDANLALGHARLSGREGPRRSLAIHALAEQLRLALQRLDYAENARTERLRAEAEAARAAVLTSLSHDLRTPLATILGAASALKELDAGLGRAARDDLLTAIEEEARRLNLHVTNLLQMTRLELATAQPRRDWVDLNDIAEAARTRAERSFAGAKITLTLAPDLAMIRSESGLLEQAVFNLIDNALHHGRPPVTLASSSGAEGLSLRVHDAGAGPPEAILSWLAGPDLRPAPRQRGLGLAVAKGIARHLGGRLVWQDGGLVLTLPLTHDAQANTATNP